MKYFRQRNEVILRKLPLSGKKKGKERKGKERKGMVS
jgi:hypothetical protein